MDVIKYDTLPRSIKYDTLPRSVERWKDIVRHGKTTLGYLAWKDKESQDEQDRMRAHNDLTDLTRLVMATHETAVDAQNRLRVAEDQIVRIFTRLDRQAERLVQLEVKSETKKPVRKPHKKGRK